MEGRTGGLVRRHAGLARLAGAAHYWATR